MRNAGLLLVVSPEYAHGVPGALKNALDWLVSGGELGGRPTAVLTGSPAPGGGEFAHAQLRETLSLLTGNVVPDACLAVGGIRTKTGPDGRTITDPATRESLRRAMTALATHAGAGTPTS